MKNHNKGILLKTMLSAIMVLSLMTGTLIAYAGNEKGSYPANNNNITSVNTATEKAENILKEMTLEEKVGQMFFVRCPDENAEKAISEYHFGGLLLFAKDFDGKTKIDVKKDIKRYQNAADIPMFVGVDEEGGSVNRISLNPKLRESPFLSPQDLADIGGYDYIHHDTEEKADLLHEFGININFAPVCDVSEDPTAYIYKRTFGRDAELTSKYIEIVQKTMEKEGMGSVLKHFPGYGNNTDTHVGIAYDNRPMETFLESDFLPFKKGIEYGADMVLVAHNIVSCMDEDYPASISKNVHDILRSELDYDGIIITDGLDMEGIKAFAKNDEIAVMAVKAGNDMLCCTDYRTQIPAVISAVESGEIAEENIDDSVLRILAKKIEMGIM